MLLMMCYQLSSSQWHAPSINERIEGRNRQEGRRRTAQGRGTWLYFSDDGAWAWHPENDDVDVAVFT